ncbi:hypothetical protein C8R43DRAFT_125449 [Mycena crocata]|nr:hypothetical protein C8R43DRAFT_125449 [Mycena crocata]
MQCILSACRREAAVQRPVGGRQAGSRCALDWTGEGGWGRWTASHPLHRARDAALRRHVPRAHSGLPHTARADGRRAAQPVVGVLQSGPGAPRARDRVHFPKLHIGLRIYISYVSPLPAPAPGVFGVEFAHVLQAAASGGSRRAALTRHVTPGVVLSERRATEGGGSESKRRGAREWEREVKRKEGDKKKGGTEEDGWDLVSEEGYQSGVVASMLNLAGCGCVCHFGRRCG